MRNEYLENLLERMENEKGFTTGEYDLARAYKHSVRDGFEVLTFDEILWEKDVEDFVTALWESNMNELYVTNQASNMLGVYLMLDKLGLKVRGIVELENPAYKRDMERWGQSYHAQYIPALKLTF